MIVKKAVILFLLFIYIPICTLAQKCEIRELTKSTVRIIPSDSIVTPTQILLAESMIKALIRKNLFILNKETKPNYCFYVDANKYEKLDNKSIFASILVIKTIPKEIVEIGVNEDAFYKALGKPTKNENLTDIGKEIRKKINSDYMQQFGMIEFQLMELLSVDNVDQFCQKSIDKFLFSSK